MTAPSPWFLVIAVTAAAVASAAEKNATPAVGQDQSRPTLPVFRHRGVVLDYQHLKYNPCNDVIIPSVIRTDSLHNPLGRYYMYYAPHNAPGGICMAYADTPAGPWKEYQANPLIGRQWAAHHKVSHVSGPHAIWIEEEKKLFVYYHGENDVTRIASTTDGIHFQYEGVAVTAKVFDAINEASYARVFRYAIPGKDNRYIMLLMGNNRGTRKIYLAWSKDGRTWQTQRTPLIEPQASTGQLAQAWYFPWQGKHFLIYHDYDPKGTDLHVSQLDPNFEHVRYIGMFYDHRSAGPDNVAQMSPCFLTEGDTIYMYTNIRPRLNQKIAVAVATVPSFSPRRRPSTVSINNAQAVAGTWLLQQVSSVQELERLLPQTLEPALKTPGLRGFCLRVPWKVVDADFALLEAGLKLAQRHNLAYSIRFMAGRHTPDRVFDQGCRFYLLSPGKRRSQPEKVPVPFLADGSPNTVFEQEYDAFVGRSARWCRANGVRLLHLAWYGQEWAELNHGREVRDVEGYSYESWLRAHTRLLDIGLKHAGPDLAVELPFSGYGPLTDAVVAFADHVVQKIGPNNCRFFCQANGWGPNGDWGAPSMEIETTFDRVWQRPICRGQQAIQPQDYDWAKMFENLRQNHSTYCEIYAPSFTVAHRQQLADEVQRFAARCRRIEGTCAPR